AFALDVFQAGLLQSQVTPVMLFLEKVAQSEVRRMIRQVAGQPGLHGVGHGKYIKLMYFSYLCHQGSRGTAISCFPASNVQCFSKRRDNDRPFCERRTLAKAAMNIVVEDDVLVDLV